MKNIGYEKMSDEHHYINTEGTRRFDSTAGELVIQAGGMVDAYARTSFMPPYAENNGVAAIHPYGHGTQPIFTTKRSTAACQWGHRVPTSTGEQTYITAGRGETSLRYFNLCTTQ